MPRAAAADSQTMSRRDRPGPRAGARPRPVTPLERLALILTLAAGVATTLVLTLHGALTAPVLALDVIAGVHLPFAVLSLLLVDHRPRRSADGDGGDGGWGGGGRRDDAEPLPPSGGLQVDWERFEADFRAYAEAVTAPAGAR